MHEIFQYIGNWGRYQVFVFSLFFIPCVISCGIIMLPVFTAGVPNVRCYVPEIDELANSTFLTPFEFNQTGAVFLPPTKVAGAEMFCHYCPYNNGTVTCSRDQARKCSKFVYDQSQYSYTLTSMFDMVCDDYYKTQVINTCTMVGILLGNPIFGNIGDKYGRRSAFLIAGISQIIILNVMPFIANFYLFCVIQSIAGALQAGSFLASFTVVMELFGGAAKTVFGVAVHAMVALGYVYVGVAAYFVRDWRYLTWTIGLLTIFYIPLYWVYPESARWLAVRHRQKEAAEIVKKAAKWNRVKIPDEVIKRDLAIDDKVHMCSLRDLFNTAEFIPVTLVAFFLWTVNAMNYYGLSWGSTSLPGNVYMNFILSGLSEIPSYVICVPMMEYIGRRFTLFSFLSTGGLCIIISGFLSHDLLVQILTNIGKLCISASYAITYLYTSEIFPTVVRNLVAGYCSSMARIGSIAATQIALLANYAGLWVPPTIYGMFAITASVLIYFLPETAGTEMTETLEEGVEFIRKHKISIRMNKCERKKRETNQLSAHAESDQIILKL